MRKNNKRGTNFIGVKNTYLVQGLNLDRFLHYAKNKGITLYDIKKITNKRIIVSVSLSESKKFFAIAKEMCYNIKKIKQKGITLPLFLLWKRVGIVLGAIIFCINAYVYSDFIYGFDFSGSGSVLEKEVLAYLNGVGIKPFSRFSDINIEKLEDQILASQKNLSFVGIAKRGNTLCFDLALASDNTEMLKGDIYSLRSDANGIIEKIKVYRGTAVVAEGDSVKNGDLLVDGYMIIKEQTLKINVIATVWIIASQEFVFTDLRQGQEEKVTLLAKAMMVDKDVVSTSVVCTKDNDEYVYRITINYRYIIYAG